MSDIVERLNVIAEADVHETWRDGTLDKHDLLKWEGIMIEAAAEITRLRAALDGERERCAKVVDPPATPPLTAEARIGQMTREILAAAIRALPPPEAP